MSARKAAILLVAIVVLIGASLLIKRPAPKVPSREPGPSLLPPSDMTTSFGRAINAARIMRISARYPGSFTITKLRLMPDGTACYFYSARDQSGRQLLGTAILSTSGRLAVERETAGGLDFSGQIDEPGGTKFQDMWRAGCQGKGTDQTEIAKKALADVF